MTWISVICIALGFGFIGFLLYAAPIPILIAGIIVNSKDYKKTAPQYFILHFDAYPKMVSVCKNVMTTKKTVLRSFLAYHDKQNKKSSSNELLFYALYRITY